MKKLLALTLSFALLAGCSGGFTANDKNYLDEKIKCKKLAEERFKDMENNLAYPITHDRLQRGYSVYSATLDTCLIDYKIEFNDEKNQWTGRSVRKIKDILNDEVLAEIATIPDKTTGLEKAKQKEIAELDKQKEDDFNKKLKLYFGEDAK